MDDHLYPVKLVDINDLSMPSICPIIKRRMRTEESYRIMSVTKTSLKMTNSKSQE